MNILLFFVLFFGSIKVSGINAHPVYQCVEYLKIQNELNCSYNHYLSKFAYKYCVRYQDKKLKFSSHAQTWLQNVKQCLIERVVEIKDNENCSTIAKSAYKHHSICYIKHGFCNLKFHDQKKVLFYAMDGIYFKNVWQTMFEIAKSCN